MKVVSTEASAVVGWCCVCVVSLRPFPGDQCLVARGQYPLGSGSSILLS